LTIEGRVQDAVRASASPARLTHIDGKRLDKFVDIADKRRRVPAAAKILRHRIHRRPAVESEKKQICLRAILRRPSHSTLQQEHAQMGFGASRDERTRSASMSVDIAGETVGLITYMRYRRPSPCERAIAAGAQPDRRKGNTATTPTGEPRSTDEARTRRGA